MYRLELIHETRNAQRLEIGFLPGENHTNEEYVRYVHDKLEEMASSEHMMGRLLKITGAASVPIACVITHKTCHLYSAIAIFDPKLSGYVVCISHDPEYKLGMVLSDEPIIV